MNRPIAVIAAPDEMTDAHREMLARVREQFDVLVVPCDAPPETVIALVREHQARADRHEQTALRFRQGMDAISESMRRAIEDARRPPVAVDDPEPRWIGELLAMAPPALDALAPIARVAGGPHGEVLALGMRAAARVVAVAAELRHREPGTRARKRWKARKRAGRA